MPLPSRTYASPLQKFLEESSKIHTPIFYDHMVTHIPLPSLLAQFGVWPIKTRDILWFCLPCFRRAFGTRLKMSSATRGFNSWLKTSTFLFL